MKTFNLKLLSICIIVSCVVAARPAAGITVISQSANTSITFGYAGQLEFENPLSGTEKVQGYDIIEWRDADYRAGPPPWYDDWTVSHPGIIDGDASHIWMRTKGHSIWTATTVASTTISIHMDADDNDGLAQIMVDGAEVARLDMLTPPGPGNALIIVKNLPYALHTITINDLGVSPNGGAGQDDVSVLGAAALSKRLVAHSKWSQPPIEINPQSSTIMYWGWDEESWEQQGSTILWPPKVADDFRCLGLMPITSIHWWGSHIGWDIPEPPPLQPIAWQFTFYSNIPAGWTGGDPNFSQPGKVLWQIQVDASRVSSEWVGYDEFPDTPPETCFQYQVNLKPTEYFRQASFEPNTIDNIYWLSIRAVYPSGIDIVYPWGWKTRPWHWMDDAVRMEWRIVGFDYSVTPPIPILGYTWWPIKGNSESFDAAFELDTDPNYIKWEQSFTGIRNWPHYSDELSMATVETIVESITKWYQKPDTYETGIDVDAYKDIWQPQVLADDFRCTTTGLITDIHIWGSWYHDHPPFGNPTQVKFTLSIHEDLPVGDPRNPNTWSMPGQVVWMKTFQPGQFEVTEYGRIMEGWFVPCSEPQYYDPYADNICWFYSFFINASEAFQQKGSPTKPVIYWLDVQAEPVHEPGFPEPIRFGVKDSTTHYQDNAVYAVGQEPIGVPGPWKPMSYPSGHPYQGQKIDLAFRITTSTTPPIKYEQPPDTQPGVSIDIDATKDPVWQPQVLADDFQCVSTDPITDIHLWGSWYHDMMPYGDANMVIFKLSIRADIPDDQSPTGYSMPGEILWEREFQPGEFKVMLYADYLYEGYLVPCSEPPYYEPYGDTICWQYDFVIDPCEAFVQQGSTTNPVIYWLSVQARQVQPMAGEPMPRSRFGWKTRDIYDGHFMDDAVWSKDGGVTWNELRYPAGHQYMGMSADLAFAITSEKTHQEFVIHRQVCDDWQCKNLSPVTTAVWWGSYIGYRYEPYQGVQPGRPIKPDYFLLSIWTDVPANTPGQPYQFSHPGTKIWEYKAKKYDEVLVGYDKHPEPQEPPGGFEPVFRYSVKLPDPNRFYQEDVNNIFWFSVVAVYDMNRPTYQWGWTNHRHVFNDDAVAGYQSPTGGWIWEELYDQTGVSEDMSFILFGPECLVGGNAGPLEYSDWVAWGRPDCWCYSRQCRGNIDGLKQGAFWVSLNDLAIFKTAANKLDGALPRPQGICADLDHKKQGAFRVSLNDLAIFKTYANKLEALVPMCDKPPIYTGPYNFWTKP